VSAAASYKLQSNFALGDEVLNDECELERQVLVKECLNTITVQAWNSIK